MKCELEFTGEINDAGWRMTKCVRPGCSIRVGWTPDPLERIHADNCRAWPRWHEFGYWVALLLEVFGLSKWRWSWLMYRLNLVEPSGGCNSCERRERWLNTLGGKTVMLWRRVSSHLSFAAQPAQEQGPKQ